MQAGPRVPQVMRPQTTGGPQYLLGDLRKNSRTEVRPEEEPAEVVQEDKSLSWAWDDVPQRDLIKRGNQPRPELHLSRATCLCGAELYVAGEAPCDLCRWAKSISSPAPTTAARVTIGQAPLPTQRHKEHRYADNTSGALLHHRTRKRAVQRPPVRYSHCVNSLLAPSKRYTGYRFECELGGQHEMAAR